MSTKLLSKSLLCKSGSPQSGSLRAVIFDLDGTLIDTAGDLAASMNHVLVANGVNAIPPGDVRHLVGFGARAMLVQGFEQSAGKSPDDEVLQKLVGDFVAYYHDHIAIHSRPFEGMIEALAVLRDAGVQLAVCTNKSERLARHLLEALGLTDWFCVIVGGDSAGAAKPDPAPVHMCLKAMGFALSNDINGPGQRAIFVGDSDTDIQAARATGLPCLVASFGYGPFDELPETKDLSDMIAVFDSWTNAPDMLMDMLAL